MHEERRRLLRFAFEEEGLRELCKLDVEFVRLLLLEYDGAVAAFRPTPESMAFGIALDYWRKNGAAMPPHGIERQPLPAEEKARLAETVGLALQSPFVVADLRAIVSALRDHWVVAGIHQAVAVDAPRDYTSPLENLLRLMERFREIHQRASVDGRRAVVSLRDVADEQVAHMEALRKQPEQARGLPTGFPTFDETYGGLYPGEITVVAGRMKTGKSTLLLGMVVAAWLAQHHALLVNREMRLETQFRRFAAMQIVRSDYMQDSWENDLLQQLKFGRLSDEQMQTYTSVWEAAKAYPYNIYKTDPLAVRTLNDVARIVRQYRDEHGIELVAVDSGNIQAGGNEEAWNQSDEQKRIAERLIDVAIENDVHVIVDVQTNRDDGLKAGAGLECLALSDWWGRYAHNILRVWPLGPSTGELQVLGSREGPGGRIPVLYDLKRALMVEAARSVV